MFLNDYVVHIILRDTSFDVYSILCTRSLFKYNVLIPLALGYRLWNICVTNDHGYVPLVVSTSRSFLHSWLITGFVTGVTRRVQELLILPGHMSSPPVFSGVRVARSLVFCVVFCRSLFVFFSFVHYVVCPSSIYGCWLLLWYVQALLIEHNGLKGIYWLKKLPYFVILV